MKKLIAVFLALTMLLSLCACSQNVQENEIDHGKEYIEKTLNLANNVNQEWICFGEEKLPDLCFDP